MGETMIRKSIPLLELNLDKWPEVLEQARMNSNSRELIFLLEKSNRLEPKQHKQLIQQSIKLAKETHDYKLLIQILKHLAIFLQELILFFYRLYRLLILH